MVRSDSKAEKVMKCYPKARIVYGSNEDLDIISEEASKADIVMHTAASDDHVPSAEAIVKGLNQRESTGPAYYIHTSGAFILAAETLRTGRYGDRFDKVYDDWDGIQELTGLPDDAPHRLVDKVVLAADPSKMRTAIVAPSVIYGLGRGPDKTSMAGLFEILLKHGKMIVLGKGENIWHNIHIQDLGKIYLRLVEAAVAGGGDASWNATGYYLAENGSYVNKGMLQLAAQVAYSKGLISNPEPVFMTVVESEKVAQWLKIMVGGDSRGAAIRARKVLDWEPSKASFEDELANTLEVAAQNINLK